MLLQVDITVSLTLRQLQSIRAVLGVRIGREQLIPHSSRFDFRFRYDLRSLPYKRSFLSANITLSTRSEVSLREI